jgi:hypothetical protein
VIHPEWVVVAFPDPGLLAGVRDFAARGAAQPHYLRIILRRAGIILDLNPPVVVFIRECKSQNCIFDT